MRKKELQADRWRKIGFLQGKNQQSQLTSVEVPASWPTTQTEFLDPQRWIENPKECRLWRTVEEPSEVEFYIQMRNRLHFGQAKGTPFTTGSLDRDIDWSASSSAAEQILLGRFALDDAEEYRTVDAHDMVTPQMHLLNEFLQSCARSRDQRSTPVTQPELTMDELLSRIRVWDERTTTSPSGMHLGHLKALTARMPCHKKPSKDKSTKATSGSQERVKVVERPDETGDKDGGAGDRDGGAGEAGGVGEAGGNRIRAERGPREAEKLPSPAQMQASLQVAQLHMINYGLRHGYAYERWCKVVNVMIEKEAGNHKIHRLRVIHLYEADLGGTFAILWKKTFESAERQTLVNQGQYGGRKGHEAAFLPYAEELKYDICRLSRKALINFDNDAASCYDRIVPSVASLLGRYHGLHPSITRMHASMLQNAAFQVKTSLGVSEAQYSHSPEHPIYGMGQGSTNSPIIWSMISSKLFDVHNSQAHGATFCTPDLSVNVQESAFGFVDDTTCQTNDFTSKAPLSLDKLVQVATEDAQIWSSLLFISGGLLELPKCSAHVVYTKFRRSGRPYLSRHEAIPTISLPDPRSGEAIEIACNPNDREHKTLGHYKAPSGSLPRQREILQRTSDNMASMVLSSFLYPAEARMVYFGIFLAKFSYVLPQCSLPKTALKQFESKAQQAFAAKMGFNRKMSCAIRYGPVALGGVGMVQFETIQGVGQILNFVKHWRSYTYIGSLLRCTLAWAQMNAGIGTPILMAPSVTLSYFESTYLQFLREYLAKIKCHIEVDDDFIPPPQRVDDEFIMEVALAAGTFDAKALKRVNYCRLYLQAVTVSDITIPDCAGNKLEPAMIYGQRSAQPQSTSKYCHTTQAKPSKSSWLVWKRLCKLMAQMLLNSPLGEWTVSGSTLRRHWRSYFDHANKYVYLRHTEELFYEMKPTTEPAGKRFVTTDTPKPWSPSPTSVPINVSRLRTGDHLGTLDANATAMVEVIGGVAQQKSEHTTHRGNPNPTRTFQEYIQTIPQADRCMLANMDVRIPDGEMVEILNHSAVEPTEKLEIDPTRCYGVSDGSECKGSMTFGWVLAAPDGFRMATGMGPAFGAQASSFRAEGYGLMAMTKVILHLRKHSGSTHKWRILLATDNQGLVTAVNQAQQYDEPFPNVTLGPDYDLIHEIVMTSREAHAVISLVHVKGHQKSKTPQFDDLPLLAQLNIEADELAREYRATTNNTKYTQAPLMSHTRCLLHSNDTKTITKDYKMYLRNTATTPALHNQMVKSFKWKKSTIGLVDWAVFRKCRSKMNSRFQQMTKFSFDILPTAAVVAKCSQAKSDLCPLCEEVPETNDHICQCSATSVRLWRSNLLADLGILMKKKGVKTELAELLIIGITSVFESLNNEATLDYNKFPLTFRPLIAEQNLIGWRQVFRGRVSREWAKHQQEIYDAQKQQKKHITGVSVITEVTSFLTAQIFEAWRQRNDKVFGNQSEYIQHSRHDKALQELRMIHSKRAEHVISSS